MRHIAHGLYAAGVVVGTAALVFGMSVLSSAPAHAMHQVQEVSFTIGLEDSGTRCVFNAISGPGRYPGVGPQAGRIPHYNHAEDSLTVGEQGFWQAMQECGAEVND